MVVLSHEFLTWIHTPRSLQTVSGDPVNVKFYPNIMSLYGFCGEEFPQCLLDEQRGLSPQESTRTTAVGQQHRSLSSCIRLQGALGACRVPGTGECVVTFSVPASLEGQECHLVK